MTVRVLCAWSTPSSAGTTRYETRRLADGTATCDCPGWTFKRPGVRGCKHTKAFERRVGEVGLDRAVRDFGAVAQIERAAVTAVVAIQAVVRVGRRAISMEDD